MSKKYKILLTIVLILIILSLGLLFVKEFIYNKKDAKKPTVYSSVIDKMDKYGYCLDDRDTKLYKEKYQELKEVLNAEEIDYQKYGEEIAQMFLIDLFTISNKVNKYDIGGLDFLYETEKEMFKNKIMDTLYEHVEDNSYNTREQKLPTVSNTIINEIEPIKYDIGDKSLDAYQINISIDYEEDLGYDQKCNIVVVKDEKIMYIAEYTAN